MNLFTYLSRNTKRNGLFFVLSFLLITPKAYSDFEFSSLFQSNLVDCLDACYDAIPVLKPLEKQLENCVESVDNDTLNHSTLEQVREECRSKLNYAEIFETFTSCKNSCEGNLGKKEACEADGEQWIPEEKNLSPFYGLCKETKKDENTNAACQAKYDDCMFTGDADSCSHIQCDEPSSETASSPKENSNGFAEEQALINRITAARNTAKAQAKVFAQQDLEQKLEAATEQALAECTRSLSTFTNACKSRPSTPQASSITSSASGRCEALKSMATEVSNANSSFVSNCNNAVSYVESHCKTSVSATGNGEAPVRGFENEQDPETASIEKTIELQGAVSSLNSVVSEKNQIDRTSASLEATAQSYNTQAEECIASTKSTYEPPTQIADTPSVNKEEEKETVSNKSSIFSGLAGLASSELGGRIGSSSSGSSGSSSSSSYKPSNRGSSSYNPSTNPYGSRRSTTNPALSTELSGTQPSYAGSGNDPDERVLEGGPNNQARNGNSQGTSGGRAGKNQRTRAGGGSGGSAGSSGSSGGSGGKRTFASAKARNFVSGYKKVKGANGSASVSIKPSDYKTFGKKALSRKLASARKAFGKNIPLIFRNGQFVRDFLAMKETEAWKQKNRDMARHMSGMDSEAIEAEKAYKNSIIQDRSVNIFEFHSKGLGEIIPDEISSPDFSKIRYNKD